MDITDELFDLYLEDMREHLQSLNESLLQLEKNNVNKDIINTIFRAFHSMKGSTSTMKYFHTAEILHKMEDMLQEMRDSHITVVPGIVQLLFECHDFIEIFVEKVSTTKSEEGIDCPEIIEKLHMYINNRVEVKNTKEVPKQFIVEAQSPLQVSISDLDYIKRKVSQGFKAYNVNVKIKADCQFKAIRAWMVYNELEQEAEIIKAYPVQPHKEDFTDSAFTFDSDEITALIISDKTSQNISSDLDLALMEIENIIVDDYELEGKITGGLISCIIESRELIENSVNNDFPDTYITEIMNHIQRAEQYCFELGFDYKDTASLSNILDSFEVIKRLSSFINHSLIFNIAAETWILLGDVLKLKTGISEVQLDLIATSLNFIKELSIDVSLVLNEEYIAGINKHLNMLFHGVSKNTREMLGNGSFTNIDGVKLGEILVQNGVVDQQNVDQIIENQNENYSGLKLGQALLKQEKASLKDLVNAMNTQPGAKVEQKSQSFIRIPEQKVDGLVDMLGELLIIQSLHRQEISDILSSTNKTDNRFFNNIIRMERITKDIQTISMSLRMVSLKQSFQKLLRIGRDTAVELNKDVNISLTGEDTEIDRSIVEKIQDSLMHLVRNAVSHGVGDTEDRIANGKCAQGQVGVNAYNKRGFVFIEVTDDGKGLSPEKLYKKAREKELIDPNKTYTDEEIIRFIYLPGFSTQESINNVSGRGVGMNVVETEILRIGGKIEISNRIGLGCTFTLKIPINLATINGMIVDVFGGRFILPTLQIKQLLKPETSQWIKIKGKQEMIKIRDEIIQVIPIEKILDIPNEEVDYNEGMIIVIELDHKLKALPVSSVLGKQEVVVKPLSADFRSLDFASGATILGDGKVSLILDVEALFKLDS